MVTRDTRFRLVDGYNLQIGNVRIQDAGKDGKILLNLVNLVEWTSGVRVLDQAMHKLGLDCIVILDDSDNLTPD
jgi:hypothetical protein